MALIEKQIIDKIEVVGDVHPMVQVRRADVILKDDIEIARSFHRHVLAPGDDVSHEDPKVQAVCAAVWTADVVAAYAAHLQSQSAALLPSEASDGEAESGDQPSDPADPAEEPVV